MKLHINRKSEKCDFKRVLRFAVGGKAENHHFKQWKLADGFGKGLGYTSAQLEQVFSGRFEILSLRKMEQVPAHRKLFGKNFLWTVLMKPLP